MIRKTFRKIFGVTGSNKKKEIELIKKRREFYLQFLKTNDTYFDIGANYGNRIAPIINDGIKIIAVEPQLQCVKYLKKQYNNKITIIQKGLGEKEGVKTMYISEAHTLSSFSKEWINATIESGRFKQHNWDTEEIIEIETLDNLILKYGKPQFIKIDVEGYEHEVLKGLSQPIEAISFEYAIPEARNSILSCIDELVKISNSNKVVFNYSIGESMEWAMNEWVSPQKMKKEIDSEKFIKTAFGDIYAKSISNST